MRTDNTDRWRAAGENASKLREAAYKSYSEATGLFRERLKDLEEENRNGTRVPAKMEQLERALSVADRMKELTLTELRHADEEWRMWMEEDRARRQESQLARQEANTTSLKWAAWGAFLAAVASAVGTGVQAWFLRPH